MTPCEKLGYKVGDRFKVVKRHFCFNSGEVVTLAEDDGSTCPYFLDRNGKPGVAIMLNKLEKVSEDPITLRPGDYVSTDGMTEEQYHAVARAFWAAGAKGPIHPYKYVSGNLFGWSMKFDQLGYNRRTWKSFDRHLTPAQVIGATNAGGKTQDTLTGALKYACDELDTARQHEDKAAEHRANHDGAMEHVRDMLPDGWRLVRDGIPADVYRSFEDQTRRQMRESDMADPANWREGDVVECTFGKYIGYKKGGIYEVRGKLIGSRIPVADDEGQIQNRAAENFRFYHRPT